MTTIETGAGDWPTLPAMFFAQAARKASKPFLWAKRGGAWRAQSWGEVAAQARTLARGLTALGLNPGDRVVLVSENRPEWLIADIAIMAAGCITVPAYVTNTADDHLHVLNNSGARAALVSTTRLAQRLLPAAVRAGQLETVIALEKPELDQSLGVDLRTWQEIEDLGVGAAGEDGGAEPSAGKREDTACIIYTSGTGGTPKGVMLSHGAILSNCANTRYTLRHLHFNNEVFLSFLPLSHSYEHTAGQFLPIMLGAQIYYAEGADTVVSNMAEARPTLMTAVPRFYETLQQRISHGVNRAGGYRKKLFDRTLELGRARYLAPESLGLGARITDAMLTLLVRRSIARRFGGRLKAFISGGAPLNYEVGLFFTALGIRTLQGYGQTETAPIVSCNPPEKVNLLTVGPPIPDAEVRIAEDGEILVRGELMMQGYWQDAEATAAAIRDGWIHTGDIGALDDDGYLHITDRKKDIIVNSGGDNVSPQRIEGILSLEPEIAQAMVYGDRKPYLVALIVADAAADGEIGNAVKRVNAKLSPLERIRHFAVAPEPFAITNGQLTPTLKIRRHVITEIYRDDIEGLYK